MTADKIKILIADDSGLMRLLISQILAEDGQIEVIDTATDGRDAYQKTLLLKPDVVLLDLVMSPYDGLYAVRHIMQEIPTPILMISGLEKERGHTVLEALQLGAFDFIAKPEGVFNSKIREIKDTLIAKIKQAYLVNPAKLRKKEQKPNQHQHTFTTKNRYDAIVIGASTGGTNAIESILLNLPANLPVPLMIVQHIPPDFGRSFAHRLNEEMPFTVHIPQDAEVIQKGRVYIAPSAHNLHLSKSDKGIISFVYTDQQYPEYNFPSVNALFSSANEVYRGSVIAIILTGMGKDGTMGMERVFKSGGLTIAQDEKSCVIFGMPRAAIEAGVVRQVLPLKEIPTFLVSALEV